MLKWEITFYMWINNNNDNNNVYLIGSYMSIIE